MPDSTLTTVHKISNEISKTSLFDSASVFVVVLIGAICLILIALIYKVITGYEKRIIYHISTVLSAFDEANSISVKKFNEFSKSIHDSLIAFQKVCSDRNLVTKKIVDDNIALINNSIEKLFNTIIGIMKDGTVCPTHLAVWIFATTMELHCHKKALKLFERCKYSRGSKAEILNLLSFDFRRITEEEKSWFDKIVYTNNHLLGEELESILKPDAWEVFINTEVGKLLDKFLGKNPDWEEMLEETMAMFMRIITPMQENIKKKGEL